LGENATAALPALIESFDQTSLLNITYYRRAIPGTMIEITPKDPQVKTLLRKGIKDKDDGVRVFSAWALWTQGGRDSELKEVWSQALKNDDPDVREAVGVVTATLGRDSPELLPLAATALKDSEMCVRRRTIQILVGGKLTQPEVRDAFIDRLTDSNEWVRAFACTGLGQMKEKAIKALPELKQTLQDKEFYVRVSAARAMFAIDPTTGPSVIEVLIEGLTAKDSSVRRSAAKGLGELGPAARPALPALRHALVDERREVREHAAEAIKRLRRITERKGVTPGFTQIRRIGDEGDGGGSHRPRRPAAPCH
jgi:hypothetical protein